jgi:hypothetical protein
MTSLKVENLVCSGLLYYAHWSPVYVRPHFTIISTDSFVPEFSAVFERYCHATKSTNAGWKFEL